MTRSNVFCPSLLVLVAVCAALLTCSLAAANDSAADSSTEIRLQEVRELVDAGKLHAAQAKLASLVRQANPPAEAVELSAEINRKRAELAIERAGTALEEHALGEVTDRLSLPETYGATRPSELIQGRPRTQFGPMEDLLNKPVSMQLEEVGVKELVFTLSEIDGLNVIADQSLSAAQRINISVRDVPLRELLDYVARNMGIDFHIGKNVIWITKAADPSEVAPELEIRIYPLQHGFIPTLSGQADAAAADPTQAPEDGELLDALDTFFSQGPSGSTFRIYRDRNLLIVRNTPANLRLIEQLLEKLDRRPPQVVLEARFITISRDDLMSVGLNLQNLLIPAEGTTAQFKEYTAPERKVIVNKDAKGNIKSIIEEKVETIPESLGEKRFDALGSGTNPGFPGQLTISGILGNVTYQAVLDAIEQKSSSKTLSAPRVTVMNNRIASIHRGKKRYYFREYELQAIDVGDAGIRTQVAPVGEAQELDTGYKLNVRVNIGNDSKTLILALKPEITEFIGFESAFGDDIRLPNITTNTLTTTVAVESGETVVLGGTLNADVSENIKKVPYLGDVPVLGRLFQTTVESSRPEHLLIFVTASIINSDGTFAKNDATNPAMEPAPQTQP